MALQFSSSRGFTVAELLVVVALVAVLAALAVPGFGALRSGASLSSSANQLLWALHFARSTAILRNLSTVVCLSADGTTCLTSSGVPASGWLVFNDVERSTPAQIAGADELLHTMRLPQDVTVRGTRAAATYWPTTRAGTTATFTICDSRGNPQGRALVVSQTGRPRVTGAVQCVP